MQTERYTNDESMRQTRNEIPDSMRASPRSRYMHLEMATKQGDDENEEQSSDHRADVRRSGPAVNGSDFAFVYATRYNDVTRWIRALGGETEDLDDLAQEVFIVVHRRL